MSSVALTGLRAENPLAFLVALGALSLLSETDHERPRMSWQEHDGSWTPHLHGERLATDDGVVEAIAAAHEKRDLEAELGWEKDVMKLTRPEARAALQRLPSDTEAARVIAACVTELPLRQPNGWVPYTPFRLVPRRGRARFLEAAVRESQNGSEHIRSCLFEEWVHTPDTQSMRWDPSALVSSRALMAEAPTHAKVRGVPGAVLLAIRGLASFPLVTNQRGRASAAGFADRRRFVWPIWRDPLQLPVARMLLSMPAVYHLRFLESAPRSAETEGLTDSRDGAAERRRLGQLGDMEAQLVAHGVVAIFTAPRVRRGDDDEALGWGEPRLLVDATRSDPRVPAARA
ncbi:MAG: type I-G CRISPR-associated protein, Cas3-extension family [Solirubrobacteraceae bacterium]